MQNQQNYQEFLRFSSAVDNPCCRLERSTCKNRSRKSLQSYANKKRLFLFNFYPAAF